MGAHRHLGGRGRGAADHDRGDRALQGEPEGTAGLSIAAAWRWCLAAGVATIACAWGFGRIPGLIACGPIGPLSPIVAFELARTPADVAHLFGAEPCRSTLAAAQRVGLWLDAFGFIPGYAAFLSFAARAAGGRRGWPVVAMVLIAALCDQVEGVALFAVLRNLPGDQATLDALAWAVRTKFLLLALSSLGIAGLLLWHRPRLSEWSAARIVGGLGVGCGAVTALRGFFDTPPSGLLTGLMLAWFILLLVALFGAVVPWRQRAGQPRAPAPPSA